VSSKRTLIVAAVSVALSAGAWSWAQSANGAKADELATQGDAALAAGDLVKAQQLFARAAQSDADKVEYQQRAMLIGQINTLRGRLAKQSDAAAWEKMARSLHAFYADFQVKGALVELDRQFHERLSTTETAMMLGRALLAADQNDEALKLLSGWPAEKQDAHTRVLWALAAARAEDGEVAGDVLAKVTLPETPDATLVFDLARARARTGEADEALKLLGKAMSLTPPSRQDRVRGEARACGDFAALVEQAPFAAALQTESKVAESSCSSGPSCGGCPSRTGCAADDKKGAAKDASYEHGKAKGDATSGACEHDQAKGERDGG